MSLQDWIQPTSWSLWSIIRGFKIGITKYAKQYNIPFARQSRYHDRIIRNNEEYEGFTGLDEYPDYNPDRVTKTIIRCKNVPACGATMLDYTINHVESS